MFKTRSLIAGVTGLVISLAAMAADVSGNWNLSVETQRGTNTPTMTLTQKGKELTGTYHSQRGDQPLTGTIEGNDVKFSYAIGGGDRSRTINYEGKVEGDSMSGKVVMGQMGEGKFTATKAK